MTGAGFTVEADEDGRPRFKLNAPLHGAARFIIAAENADVDLEVAMEVALNNFAEEYGPE